MIIHYIDSQLRIIIYYSYVYIVISTLYFHVACNCSSVGSNNPEECSTNGGQCSCKPNVIGRTCDQCRPDFFNFTSGQGCQGKTVTYTVYICAKCTETKLQ